MQSAMNEQASGAACWPASLLAPSPKMRQFDELDRRILAMMASDARMTKGQMTRKLGISTRRTVRKRLQRLEQEGVITGYAARIDERVLGPRVVAFVNVGFRPRSQAAIEALQCALRDSPEIRESYLVAGTGDLLIKVCADSVDTLYRLVLGRLGACEGVHSLRSTLVVGEIAAAAPAE